MNPIVTLHTDHHGTEVTSIEATASVTFPPQYHDLFLARAQPVIDRYRQNTEAPIPHIAFHHETYSTELIITTRVNIIDTPSYYQHWLSEHLKAENSPQPMINHAATTTAAIARELADIYLQLAPELEAQEKFIRRIVAESLNQST